MKYLGILATITTLIAVINSFIAFGRLELPFWRLLGLTWPAAVGVALFVAAMMGVGWASSRLLARIDKRPHPQDHPASGRSPEGQHNNRPTA